MSCKPTARTHRSICWPALGWFCVALSFGACAGIEETGEYGEVPVDLDTTTDDTSSGGATSTMAVTSDVVTVTIGASSTESSESASSTSSSTTSAASTDSGSGGASTTTDSATADSTTGDATTTVSSGGASSTMSVTMASTMSVTTMANVNTVNTVSTTSTTSTTGGQTGSCGTINDFSSAPNSFTYYGTDSTVSFTHNSGAGTMSISGTNNNYIGVGIVLGNCIDATACTGVAFDIGGSVASGESVLQLRSESNLSTDDGGTCSGTCSNNEAGYNMPSSVQTVQVAFSSLTGGSPVSPASGDGVCGFQWQFHCADGGACAVDVTLDNLRFY